MLRTLAPVLAAVVAAVLFGTVAAWGASMPQASVTLHDSCDAVCPPSDDASAALSAREDRPLAPAGNEHPCVMDPGCGGGHVHAGGGLTAALAGDGFVLGPPAAIDVGVSVPLVQPSDRDADAADGPPPRLR